MPNLSDSKLLSGRSAVIGYSTLKGPDETESTLPLSLPPEAYEGSWTYVEKQMLFSDGASWVTPAPPVIRTPVPIEPTNSYQQRLLRITGFLSNNSLVTQTGVLFVLSFSNKTLSNPVYLTPAVPPSLTTANTYILPLGSSLDLGMSTRIEPGTVFYWKAKYTGTLGQESAFSRVQTQVFPYHIDKPVPVNTVSGARTNAIEISPFISAFSDEISHYSTQWEIYGAVVVPGQPTVPTQTPQISFDDREKDNRFQVNTATNTVYYWRARQMGIGRTGLPYESPWSDLQRQLQLLDVGTPVILNETGVTKELRISSFTGSSSTTRFQQVEWEIYDGIEPGTPSVNQVTKTILSFDPILPKLDTRSLLSLSNPQDPLVVPLQLSTGYYWRARFLANSNGSNIYSEYTTGGRAVPFEIPSIINKPISTITNNTPHKELEISTFFSYYDYEYYSTTWYIYESVTVFDQSGNPLTPLLSINVTATTIESETSSGLLLANPLLTAGRTYYWIARYTGVNINNSTDYQNSAWTDTNNFIQQSTFITPTITGYTLDNTVNGFVTGSENILGPSLVFKTDPFPYGLTDTSVPEILLVTRWLVYSYTLRNGNIIRSATPIAQSDQYYSLNNYPTSVTFNSFDENSSYIVTVQHIGQLDDSIVAEFSFSTALEYRNMISIPSEKPSSILRPGSFWQDEGGYYAGEIWNNVAETNTLSANSTRISQLDLTVNRVAYGTPEFPGYIDIAKENAIYTRTFLLTYSSRNTTPANTYLHTDNIPYFQNLTNNAIFYQDQIVQARSKNDPTVWLEGVVIRGYSNKLVLGIYKTNGIPAGNESIIEGGFNIMTRYHIMLSPNNTGFFSGVSLLEYRVFVNSRYVFSSDPIPYECFSLAEGYKSTQALIEYSRITAFSPAALQVRTINNGAGINGFNDWYIPSRDELVLCYYYLNNYGGNIFKTDIGTPNGTFDGTVIGEKRLDLSYINYGRQTPAPSTIDVYGRAPLNYTTFGSFPDRLDVFSGTNKNSVIPLNEYNILDSNNNGTRMRARSQNGAKGGAPYYDEYVLNYYLGSPIKNAVMPAESLGNFTTTTIYNLSTSTLFVKPKVINTFNTQTKSRTEYYSTALPNSTSTSYVTCVRQGPTSAPGGEAQVSTESTSQYYRLVRRRLVGGRQV